ncbi:TetR/AcrR family transcriptional regulator [Pseudonocardia endophytica]|uniref:TetR family transcriptional regulator n=1 Tax=Pseudonocardia endophytica TaxID=401976 RepID=A0A4R1I0F4_PSEEN|nr:TetR/AcrR family transcriptional regulator [Pseudonocardia endophytica]TCK27331.1 TetR family transcriptional regulator [Pseudonocardia endophytica]
MARTTDPERTRARRAAIRDAAAVLFATKGFDTTTAADIARAAGISAGSVFYWFPDKAAVFREIFVQDLADSHAIVARHADVADPLEAVLGMVDELGAPARDPYAGNLVVELIRRLGHDEELAAIVTESTAVVHTGLTALVRRGRDDGVVAADLDPAEAAGWVQTIVDGAFLSADPSRDPVPMLRRIVTAFLTSGGDTR